LLRRHEKQKGRFLHNAAAPTAKPTLSSSKSRPRPVKKPFIPRQMATNQDHSKSTRRWAERHRLDWCAFCERERLFRKPPRREWVHELLTFLTLGLWGFVWAAVHLDWRWKEPWRCCTCGHRLRAKALATGVLGAAAGESGVSASPESPTDSWQSSSAAVPTHVGD
jgi:hypothetical protein